MRGLTLAEKSPAATNRALAIFRDRAHMCVMLKDFDPTDYSIVVKSRAPLPKPWRWEIYCAGKRQPIQRSDVFFEFARESERDRQGSLGAAAGEADVLSRYAVPSGA